jgi:protein-S-isoprenylcysteine O-methyltransferase Ste14
MMFVWFYTGIAGLIGIIPLLYLSVEHQKFDKKYGEIKGKKITACYGRVSGWALFLFWIIIWVSPQPRFHFLLFKKKIILPFLTLAIPITHLIISIPLILLAIWLGISGVKKTTLKTAETHRTDKIVSTGVYSRIRHPQYVAGLIAHVGIVFLLSARYALLFFPLMVVYVYVLSKKEEKELINEFGDIYLNYQKKVPMFIPGWFSKKPFFT